MTPEQIQAASEREYPALGDAPQGNPQWFIANQRAAYIKGANFALSSDTVKGMVEALGDIFSEDGIHYISMKAQDKAKTALNNYNESIK